MDSFVEETGIRSFIGSLQDGSITQVLSIDVTLEFHTYSVIQISGCLCLCLRVQSEHTVHRMVRLSYFNSFAGCD